MDPAIFDHYRTHIPHVDDDHWEMLVLVERIGSLCKEKKYDEMEPAIQKLSALKRAHAKHEEAFIAKIGYPFIESHKQEHEKVNKTLREFCGTCVDKQSSGHCSHLTRLLLDHFDHYDLRFVPYHKEWMEKQKIV